MPIPEPTFPVAFFEPSRLADRRDYIEAVLPQLRLEPVKSKNPNQLTLSW